MNLDHLLVGEIAHAIEVLYKTSVEKDKITLQETRKEFSGDRTLVVFPLIKISGKNPEITGQELGELLVAKSDLVSGFNVVKGFLNLEIKDEFWLQKFINGEENDVSGKSIMVEYSSPNTNKPLHLGHIRNNLLGFAVARILKAAGNQVTMANLINDRGIHICKSMLAWQKWGNNETPETSGMKGDHLVGKYYVRFDQEYKKEIDELKSKGIDEESAKKNAPLIKEAQEMLQKWEKGDPEVIGLWKRMNGWVYDGFNKTYEKLGVGFDKFYYESETYLLGKNIVEDGLSKGVFYKKADSSVWIDLTSDGLDEKLLLRSDGTSVYITQDLGTAVKRHEEFQIDKLIYVVGNEQDYHFKVLQLILKKMGYAWAEGIYHLSYGMVDLPSGKMKSREGTVVDADDLIEDMISTAKKMTLALGKIENFTSDEAENLYRIIGLGALKYFILKVDPKKRMLFNPEESIDFNGHTGPFIQYTYARIRSILRKADKSDELKKADLTLSDIVLESKERELLKVLYSYNSVLSEAAASYSPALMANYIYELSKMYNQFYHEHPILGEKDLKKARFRVLLSEKVSERIKEAMALLGIEVPERM